MSETLRAVVTFLFKMRGWNGARERELAFEMSMKRKWFSHSNAQRVVEAMVSQGLVREEGGMLVPTFEMPEAEMPADWKPELGQISGLEPPKEKASDQPRPAARGTPGPSQAAQETPSGEATGRSSPAGVAAGDVPKREATPPLSPSSASSGFKLDDEGRAAVVAWGLAEGVVTATARAWKENAGVGDGGALLLAGYEHGMDVSTLVDWARGKDAVRKRR